MQINFNSNLMKNNIVVIFSSHLSEEENQKFINHINDTIGVTHNVVCYTNYNQYSLTEVYNKAIDEYSDENVIIVFCHPDIIIKTKNWGKILLSKFNNTNFNIIGVAGSTFMPESGTWWEDRSKMCGIVEHTNGLTTWISEYSKEIPSVKEVVVIDGLFMAIDCNNIIHKFDENYKGFHFYEISMVVPNYLDGCDIGVTTSIRILHKSVGQTNQEWENNRIKFANQWRDELPITIPPQYNEINIKLITKPKVTVIIPTKNNLKYLRNNIWSWKDIVKYENYEIIIADTGSDINTINQYNEFLSDKIKLVRYNYYNFGKINNDVVKNHVSDDTELVLFCNDDILLLNDVLSRCVEIYNDNKENVGTIGIRLHYGDASIQHNGITIIKDGDNIRLSHQDIRKTEKYQTTINYNSQGNTGGFMLIRKNIFDSYDGFNENYIECLEDVELNLKCKHQGLKHITVSDAVAYHYESISRNKLAGGDERFVVDYERLKLFIETNNIIIK